jgi:hypothetical protein
MQRKRGGQPGNQNALKHGRRSKILKRARRQARQAAWEAEQERSRAWAAACPATDYGAIADALKRLRGGVNEDFRGALRTGRFPARAMSRKIKGGFQVVKGSAAPMGLAEKDFQGVSGTGAVRSFAFLQIDEFPSGSPVACGGLA